MTRILLILLLWQPWIAVGAETPVSARPVPLNIDAPDEQQVGRLLYRGGVHLRSRDARFMELSALHIEPDGRSIVALSDRGHWLTARLALDEDGTLVGLEDARMGELRGPGGAPLGPRQRDAESIAPAPQGGYLVAFEREHRIWHYPSAEPPFSAPPAVLEPPSDLHRQPFNEGVEALAVLADGRILALSEGLFDADGNVVGWVGEPGQWKPVTYRRTERFVPTGAATLPSGDVLVLERRFSVLEGLGARVVLVRAHDIAPDRTIEGEELARLESPRIVDNFEGIDAHVTDAGETFIYLLSDNNNFPLQRTLLLQFVLTGGSPEPSIP